jgi:hypothetical protein
MKRKSIKYSKNLPSIFCIWINAVFDLANREIKINSFIIDFKNKIFMMI